jgi:hypothetical protein
VADDAVGPGSAQLEARTIPRVRPHFNRRLKQPGGYAWVRFDPRDPFPSRRDASSRRRAVASSRPFPGGRRLDVALARLADALGLRTCEGRSAPDPAARCLRLDLGQCSAPCVARCTPGAYGRALARAVAALGGGDPGVAFATGARAEPDPAALPPGVAGALRALRAARIAPRVLALVPAVPGPGHRLLAVAGGRLRGGVSTAETATLANAFARAIALLAGSVPALVAREALDEVRVVTGWLAGPAGRAATIDLARGRAAAWAELVRRVNPGPLFSCGARPGPDERVERRAVGRRGQLRELLERGGDVAVRALRDRGQHAGAADAREPASTSAGVGRRLAKSRPSSGVLREREDDRQRRIAVTQVDAARLAGDGRLSLDVEQVVAHLEGEPDVPPARRHRLDDAGGAPARCAAVRAPAAKSDAVLRSMIST